LVKLVEATDQELFQLLSSCVCLECDPARLNRALKTLTANGVSIQDLRFAFAFEETGTGFSRANLGRFHLECLDVANSSGSLNIHLFSIRGLLADGELPCLRQALDRVYQALSASFHSVQNKKPSSVYARLDQELKELQTAGYISVAGNWQEVPTAAEVVGIVQIRRLVACLLSYLETRSALLTWSPTRVGGKDYDSNRYLRRGNGRFTGFCHSRERGIFLDCNCVACRRHLSHLGGPRLLSIRHRPESHSSYCGSVQRHVDCRRTDLSYYILSHAADGRVRHVRSGHLSLSILWCWDWHLLAPAG
jgi:hypothetical protein